MGWFRKRRPVYSEIGEVLWRVLTSDDDWRCAGGSKVVHGETGFSVTVLYRSVWLRHGQRDIEGMLTSDDLRRLRPAAKAVVDRATAVTVRRDRERVVADLRAVNFLLPKPPTFDALSRQLAQAVLDGDRTAARALYDHLQENPSLLEETP